MARTTTEAPAARRSGLADNVRTIVYAILIAVGVRTFLFEPFNIPSGSMMPTLLVGDYVFTTKYSYGFSRFSFMWSPDLFSGRILFSMPHRGDVVVFRETHDTSVDYIKRVVGLPGDRIQMRDGQLYLDDVEVPRTDAGPYSATDERGMLIEGQRYREALPSSTGGPPVLHPILKETSEGPANNTPVYTVPPGDFFAMGDNRDDSADSRFQGEEGLGYVPLENLVGHARIVFFSIDLRDPIWEFWEWPAEIRWNRLFRVIP